MPQIQDQKSASVTSKDGTIISYQITGTGPGLILIPGVLALAADYSKLADTMGKQFTVYTMERRGRGLSDPQGENYSLKKECDDVRALLDKTGTHFIVGHSFGGLVALEVSRNNSQIKKIAVYEAAVCIDSTISISWIPAYKKSLGQGKYLEAFCIFSIAAGPAKAQKTPLWAMKLLMPFFIKKEEREKKYSLLLQNLKEHEVVVKQNNTINNYKEISANVLIMSGQKSDIPWISRSLKALTEIIPHSEQINFPTLDHFGPDKSGPALVGRAVTVFFQKK